MMMSFKPVRFTRYKTFIAATNYIRKYEALGGALGIFVQQGCAVSQDIVFTFLIHKICLFVKFQDKRIRILEEKCKILEKARGKNILLILYK